ncbi:MAG: hypothetical protein IPJ24_04950 [bacterium]|nr:hypothetical protein [bacterium]
MPDNKHVKLTEGQKKGQKPSMPNVPPRPQLPPPTQYPKMPSKPGGN